MGEGSGKPKRNSENHAKTLDNFPRVCYNKTDLGVSPSGKATDSDSVIRWFESSYPSHL